MSTATAHTRRSLPAKDAVLVTVGFLYDQSRAGVEWDIWLGDGGANTPIPGPHRGGGWVPAAPFLPVDNSRSNLAMVPSALVVVARPTPAPYRVSALEGLGK